MITNHSKTAIDRKPSKKGIWLAGGCSNSEMDPEKRVESIRICFDSFMFLLKSEGELTGFS